MRQGDHLRARRDGAFDHAVDLGDRTVMRWRSGHGVERCSLAEFAAGGVEVVVHRERVYRPALVVARAFSRLGEAAFARMFATAEQFATWCKSGQIVGAPVAEAAPARKAARKVAARKARPGAKTRKAAPRAARPARKAPARKAARKVAPPKPVRKPARKVARKPAPRKRARQRRPGRRR